MGTCYNCGKEITLKDEEVKCDNCGEVVNFPCINCHEWFSIAETKLCKTCGYYICPNCNSCDINCQKSNWQIRLKDILGSTINREQLNKILDLIEEIKIGKDRRCCPKGVSISYAKSRIKSCYVRLLGYRVKSDIDLDKFLERYDKIIDVPLGRILTINQSREEGSYGQEYRDVFNLAVCRGKLKVIKKKKKIGDSLIEYEVYERSEEGQCPMFETKKLIIKICTNPKCKIKEFPLSQEECCYCKYKKGNKKGQFYPLKIKISNKDTCQLNRGKFKKREDGEGQSD